MCHGFSAEKITLKGENNNTRKDNPELGTIIHKKRQITPIELWGYLKQKLVRYMQRVPCGTPRNKAQSCRLELRCALGKPKQMSGGAPSAQDSREPSAPSRREEKRRIRDVGFR